MALRPSPKPPAAQVSFPSLDVGVIGWEGFFGSLALQRSGYTRRRGPPRAGHSRAAFRFPAPATRLLECSRMELEQDLGELDDSESSSLPLEERKVFTQPLDLSVQTLVEQWTLDVLVLPEIQRQYVWDDGKASRLVESLLLKIPIPVLYFAETEEAKFEIIDGHQRVRSIARYMRNEFALSGLPFLKGFKRVSIPPAAAAGTTILEDEDVESSDHRCRIPSLDEI